MPYFMLKLPALRSTCSVIFGANVQLVQQQTGVLPFT